MDKVLTSFYSKIQITESCWLWRGFTIRRKGEEYGLFSFEGKTSPAIGTQLGISEDTVRRILKATNIWNKGTTHAERKK